MCSFELVDFSKYNDVRNNKNHNNSEVEVIILNKETIKPFNDFYSIEFDEKLDSKSTEIIVPINKISNIQTNPQSVNINTKIINGMTDSTQIISNEQFDLTNQEITGQTGLIKPEISEITSNSIQLNYPISTFPTVYNYQLKLPVSQAAPYYCSNIYGLDYLSLYPSVILNSTVNPNYQPIPQSNHMHMPVFNLYPNDYYPSGYHNISTTQYFPYGMNYNYGVNYNFSPFYPYGY